MDPLKMAYGVKRPLDTKTDHIQELLNNQKRYYPTTRTGDLDEWGAVQQHRHEVYERQMAEAAIQKVAGQKDYRKTLDNDVLTKKQMELAEQQAK